MSAGSPNHDAQVENLRQEAPRYQPLVIVLLAVAAGILVDRYRPLPLAVWWSATFAGLAGWIVLWRRQRLVLGAVVILLAAASLGGTWHHYRWYLFPADDLGNFARTTAQPTCIEVLAMKTPRRVPVPPPDPMRLEQAEDQVRFEVELVAIRDGADWRPATGRARLAVMGLLPEVQAGDRLQVFGQLFMPPSPHNPGEFDVAAHFRSNRIRSQLRAGFPESVTLLVPGRPWWPRRLLEQIRTSGNRLFERHLDQRLSALASAVLLGTREQLDPEQTEAFLQTGTVHLLSISGMHLSVLAGVVLFLLRRAPISRAWALAAIAAFIVFYTLLVDAEPPIVRAMILVLAACTAAFMGRHRLGFNALAAAALFVLAVSPSNLFNTGAQLSFVCVAVLMWFSSRWSSRAEPADPLERLIAENRGWAERLARTICRGAWDLTCAGAVVWLITLPLVMARFHLFTPVAIVLNTLVWIPAILALVTGFALLVAGMLLPPLAYLLAGPCNLSFGLLDWLVARAQQFPLSHFWVPGPEDWWLAVFYAGPGFCAAFPRLRPPRRWLAALVAGWAATGFAAAWLRADPHQLRCNFLAVGHGEAIVLELPAGQTMLYDAGQMAAPVTATRSVAGYLWSRGITHLDAIVLSHGDVDHYNALPGLLDRFSVGVIYVSPMMFENDNEALAALRQAIARHKVPVREVWAGQRLAAGRDCQVEVQYPPRRGVLLGSDNANSIVLAVQYQGHRILLTGDLEPPGLDDVLAEPPLACEVLLVPHHGSRAGQPESLAGWSTPRWAVISASHRWDTRPVEDIYRRAGSQVLHTADCGAVTVTINAGKIEVKGFVDR